MRLVLCVMAFRGKKWREDEGEGSPLAMTVSFRQNEGA